MVRKSALRSSACSSLNKGDSFTTIHIGVRMECAGCATTIHIGVRMECAGCATTIHIGLRMECAGCAQVYTNISERGFVF